MKKPARRDAMAAMAIVVLGRSVLEHITAGRAQVDPIAGARIALTPDGRPRDR